MVISPDLAPPTQSQGAPWTATAQTYVIRVGAGGFAGSGAATTQAQQQRQQMVDQFGRQRRGVVEGYQADVLSAIADIERKGEFEFGGGGSDADTSKASSLVKDALSTIQSKLPATGTDANQSTIESDPMQDWYDQQYG